MSDEMVWSLVRDRQAEGASDEQIRRELTALGVAPANIEVLLAPPPPNWDATLFWLQLAPLALAPLIALILAVVLPRPQLAVAMVVIGFLMYMLAAFALLVMAFAEHVMWGIAMLLIPLAPLAFTVLHIDRTWKLALTYIVGVALCIGATVLEPEVLKWLFRPGHAR